MKKLKLGICFVMAFIITVMAAKTASAYFYNITHSCQQNICLEGQEAIWTVDITNDGNADVEYIALELLGRYNNSVFASLMLEFNPLSDKRGDLIVLRPGSKVRVNLTSKLPKANYRQALIYYPCFTTAITDSYIIASENKYESRHCYEKNETMPLIECISNSNCKSDQFCNYGRCIKLNCKPCQYIKDNKCNDYQCCSSEQCKFDESCMNNTCEKLGCNFNEYIFNHTCYGLNCAFDEIIINKTCRKLDCSNEEYAFNGTCKKLSCSENEAIGNHSCVPLNCKQDEQPKNHACVLLECRGNETISNNACVPLTCYFFQGAAAHKCTNNNTVIFKSLLELGAIIGIIVFFVLDYRKYGQAHDKDKNQSKSKGENKIDLAIKEKSEKG